MALCCDGLNCDSVIEADAASFDDVSLNSIHALAADSFGWMPDLDVFFLEFHRLLSL